MGGVPAQLAIMVVDDDRRCLEANLAACRLLGLPRRAVIGRTFDDFLAAGMRSRVDHVWRAFREGGGHAGPFELSSQAAATEEVHITVTANVLPGRHLLILSGGGARSRSPRARRADPQGDRQPRSALHPRGPHLARARGPGPPRRRRDGRADRGTPRALARHRPDPRSKREGKARRPHRAQAVALALQGGMIELT